MTHQARIGEIDPRRFDQPFAEILEERGDEKNLAGNFQNAQPLADGRDRPAQRRGKIGLVEDLAAAAGQAAPGSDETSPIPGSS